MRKAVILLLAAMCAGVMYGQTKQRIAVYVTGGESGDNQVFGAKLRDAIVQSGDYEAVERTDAFLEQLRKEQTYQRSGHVDDKDIARLGKQSGVQFVCVAELMPVKDGSFATARLVDVEKASVISSADGAEQIKNLPSLISMSSSIASQLLRDASKYKPGEGKERIAVYVAGGEQSIQKLLAAKMVSAITQSEKYVAMERTGAFLQLLKKEQNYQYSGSVDETQLARLGKQFGVKYVCVVRVANSFGSEFLDAILINVETSVVKASANDALTENDLQSLIRKTKHITTLLLGGTNVTEGKEVIINGVRWATCNVAAPGTFAVRPEDAGMFYQWNRKKAWDVTGEVTDWDNTYSKGGTWEKANDPSPAGWRIPTKEETGKLYDKHKVDREWTTVNGVNGCKFTDKATGNSLFLPAAGSRHLNGTLYYAGEGGRYWGSTAESNESSAYSLDFGSGYTEWHSVNRKNGQSVRAVAE